MDFLIISNDRLQIMFDQNKSNLIHIHTLAEYHQLMEKNVREHMDMIRMQDDCGHGDSCILYQEAKAQLEKKGN